VARHNNLKVYAPSSIAAFGPNIELENVKDEVVLRPQTIYGVSKVRNCNSILKMSYLFID
jgi:threonine 3-dehydrogenase